jgi:hypothetical protein
VRGTSGEGITWRELKGREGRKENGAGRREKGDREKGRRGRRERREKGERKESYLSFLPKVPLPSVSSAGHCRCLAISLSLDQWHWWLHPKW